MKAVVISTKAYAKENPHDHLTRVSSFASNVLDIPLISDLNTANIYNDKYDIVFVRHCAPLVWCNYRNIVFDIVKNAKMVIFLETNYESEAERKSFKTDAFVTAWTSTESQGMYMNWCKLSWFEFKKIPVTHDGIFYYGKARTGRFKYFEKYFSGNLPYELSISPNGSEGIQFFYKYNHKIHFIEKFKTSQQIGAFQASLYIEDEFSNENYTSPANRFYECLSAHSPMLFDKSCENTFKKAGYDIGFCTVDSQKDVVKMLKNSVEIGEKQYDLWARDYKAEAKNELLELYNKTLSDFKKRYIKR